jgi:hypothetical protein
MTSIALLSVVLLGSLILVLGTRLAAQMIEVGRAEGATIEDYLRAERVLGSVVMEAETMKRILSCEDVHFIAEHGTREVQKLFESERKRLALRWVRATQKQVSDLLKLHLMLARYTSNPMPKFDFELSAKCLVFKLISNVVLAVIWVVGPFRAASVVTYTLDSAGYFCSIFRLRHVDVRGSRLASAPVRSKQFSE